MKQFDSGQLQATQQPAAAANEEFAARAVATAAAAFSAAASSAAAPSAAAPASAVMSARWGPEPTSRPPPGWKVPPHLAHVADEVAKEVAAEKAAAAEAPK